MPGRRPIGPVDTMWLNMDRPNNLMVIDAIMWFDQPVDAERLESVVRRRLVETYPVFSQRPRPPLLPVGMPYWEDDPEFSLANHLRRVTLPPPGDQAALRGYVEQQVARPFDRDHPLWELHVIDGYGSGSAVLTRMHHSLADGIALAQVLLSLTDDTPTGDLEELDAGPGRAAPSARAGRPGAGGVGAVTGLAVSTVRGGLHLLAEAPTLAAPSTLAGAARLARQTAGIVDKLLLGTLPDSPLRGTPGPAKRTIWTAPVALDDVKLVGRLTGATVNDVLVAAVSGAIHSYVRERGGSPADVTTMVPVNLRPVDRPLPRELGNRFALVLLPLPSGVGAPLQRVAESKRRMDAIKESPEAWITLGISAAIGRVVPRLEKPLVDFFSGKAIGVTTNVIGPRRTRYVAGTPIAGVLGWVPGSGVQTLGVAIFSYAGKVWVGFKADAAVVADPELLVHAFEDEMDRLLRLARAA